MRKNEIQVGGEYAVVEYSGSRPRRARVDGFGAPRRVYSGSRDYRGHTVNDGVYVTWLDEEGQPQTRTKVETVELETPIYAIGQLPVTTEEREVTVEVTAIVMTRNIERTWEAQVEANATRADAQAAREQYEAQAKSALKDVNARLVAAGILEDREYGPKAEFPYVRTENHGYRGYTDYSKVTVPASVLHALIEKAGL